MNKPQTICHAILQCQVRASQKIALKVRNKKDWTEISWKNYYNHIRQAHLALKKYGVKAGDRVGIMASTRHEWSVCDFAIMSLGAITVPIYPNSTNSDFEFIINDSGLKFLFIESRAIYKQWLMIKEACPKVEKVVTLEKNKSENTDVFTFSEFMDSGETDHPHPHPFEAQLALRTPEEVATIIYTSGTTGTPKGVVLTHRQIISEVQETFAAVGVHHEDISLSFLPYAHVLGRIEHWGHMYVGFTMAYADSLEKMQRALSEVKPTILMSVPRVFEKIYTQILSQSETSGFQSSLCHWAIETGKKFNMSKQQSQLAPGLTVQYALADTLVLEKIRAFFGGQLRFAISGGAPLAKEIFEFFHASGVLILEGYGLTESTGAIFVNKPWDYEFGTVGKPVGDVQIQIAQDGEVLIKSDKIMKQYFNDPELTKKTIENGWLHTGDIGEITPNGNLKITDRKKDLIKTAGGKFIAPQKLEGMLKQLPFISNALISGDKKKYVVALLTLDKNYILDYAREHSIHIKSLAELKDHPKVQELVRSGMANINSQLASFESIKRYSLLPNDFSIEEGEITPSQKIRRKFLELKYREKIDSLY